MGRIEIAKLVTQGVGNPCYITEELPVLKEKVYVPGNAEGIYPGLRTNTSYPPPIDSNYILGPFTNQQPLCREERHLDGRQPEGSPEGQRTED